MTVKYDSPSSPRWNAITKLVVALVIVVILGALLIRFRNLIAPILMASVVAYLLHPVASFLTAKTHLSWKTWVNIIYLILVGILGTLLTLGGMELVQQVQNLIRFIQITLTTSPLSLAILRAKSLRLGRLSRTPWKSIGAPSAIRCWGISNPPWAVWATW